MTGSRRWTAPLAMRWHPARPVRTSLHISANRLFFDVYDAHVQHFGKGPGSSRRRLVLGCRRDGGRDQKKPAHLWDGQLARAAIDGVEVIFDRDRLPAETAWLEQKLPVPTRADPQLEALTDFCHALLCSNEFLYLH